MQAPALQDRMGAAKEVLAHEEISKFRGYLVVFSIPNKKRKEKQEISLKNLL